MNLRYTEIYTDSVGPINYQGFLAEKYFFNLLMKPHKKQKLLLKWKKLSGLIIEKAIILGQRFYHKKIDQFILFKKIIVHSYKVLLLPNRYLPKVSTLNYMNLIFKKKTEWQTIIRIRIIIIRRKIPHEI